MDAQTRLRWQFRERTKAMPSFSIFKRINPSGNLSRGTRRAGNAEYDAAVESFKGRFRDLLDEMSRVAASSARPVRSEFAARYELVFRDILDSSYEQAFRSGALYIGDLEIAQGELGYAVQRAINQAINSETMHFRNLAKRFWDAGADGLQPPVEGTVQAYANSLEAQFWNGIVTFATESMRFNWELGSNEDTHCVDCLSLAENGPYTRDNLPTVPRAGDTRCVYRCRCKLRIMEG